MRKTSKTGKDDQTQKGRDRIYPEKGSSRYPWDDWFSRGKVTLVKGKDFYCQPHGMAMNARHAAKRKGIKVAASVDGDNVTITVH